jgi:phosphatidylserine decarboxylase
MPGESSQKLHCDQPTRANRELSDTLIRLTLALHTGCGVCSPEFRGVCAESTRSGSSAWECKGVSVGSEAQPVAGATTSDFGGGWVSALRLLPKNAISRLMGRVAGVTLPSVLRGPCLGAFGRAVGADFSEMRDPVQAHVSLQAFFTRALRPGARPIDPDSRAFVSPCDGAWGEAGRVESGMLLQVKGRPYSLVALLGDAGLAEAFEGGTFATFYLSPRDYHRFHTPCALSVLAASYLPGALWPVNRIGLDGVPSLFAENERIVAQMRMGAASDGEANLALVAVGATLVGKVHVEFDDLTTNLPGALPTTRSYAADPARFEKGAEWGRFEFGSTIVMVARPNSVDLDVKPLGTPLRLGTRIGTLKNG